MSRFIQPKIEDFRELLKAEKGWVESVGFGNEYVFTYTLKQSPHIVIKVWSSVHNLTGMKLGEYKAIAANRGGDSIKVCVVDIKADKGLRKTPHINRTAGWNDRVKERVIELLREFKDIS